MSSNYLEVAHNLPASAPIAAVQQELIGPSGSGTAFLLAEAARTFGADISARERLEWSILLGLAYSIDKHLDEAGGQVEPFIDAVFSGDRPNGIESKLWLRSNEYLESLSPQRQRHFLDQLGRIDGLMADQRRATKPQELVAVRTREASVYADLLSLPLEQRQDQAGRKKFNEWELIFSRAGYIFDSFLDVREDFENGQSSVRPTMAAKAWLGQRALREVAVLAKNTPLSLHARIASVGINYFIRDKKPQIASED